MTKDYCNRCKKVDIECGVLIVLNANSMKYGSSKKIEEILETIQDKIVRLYVKFPMNLSFCGDCFIELFDIEKYKNICAYEYKTRKCSLENCPNEFGGQGEFPLYCPNHNEFNQSPQ